MRVPYLICPSGPNHRERPDGPTFVHYPLNYAGNAGLWHIYQPSVGKSTGVLQVNKATRFSEIADGLSDTVGVSEVKAFVPYLRDGGNPSGVAAIPTSPSQLASFGGEFKADSGHTEWVDACVHQTGYTTTLPPNTKCPYVVRDKTYDIDFNSMREGLSTTIPTYVVVTSRSHHVGLVQVLFMDGSTYSVAVRSSWQLGVRWVLGTVERSLATEGLETRKRNLSPEQACGVASRFIANCWQAQQVRSALPFPETRVRKAVALPCDE